MTSQFGYSVSIRVNSVVHTPDMIISESHSPNDILVNTQDHKSGY